MSNLHDVAPTDGVGTRPLASCSVRAHRPWLTLLAVILSAAPAAAQDRGNQWLLEIAIDRVNNVDSDSAIALATRVLRSRHNRAEEILALQVVVAAYYPEQRESRDRPRAREAIHQLFTRFPGESQPFPESLQWPGLNDLLRMARGPSRNRSLQSSPIIRRATAPPSSAASEPRSASQENPTGFVQILEPSEWSGAHPRPTTATRGSALRIVGFARHPNGVVSVEVNGAVAALSPAADGTQRFVAYIRADSAHRDVVVVVRGAFGLPGVVRYSIGSTVPTSRGPATSMRTTANTTFHGKRWAVVVGISQYADTSIANLHYADADARAFYEFLRSPRAGGDGFDSANVKLLLNSEATYRNLRSALFTFLKSATEDDEIIIFFAGHGAPDPLRSQNLYLLTYDTEARDFAGTAFPMEDMSRALRSLYARNILVITDACHSGAVGGAFAMRGLDKGGINDAFLAQLSASTGGLAIFTASGTDQASFEDARWGGGHGVFTHYLLEGLKGAADEDGDHIVTLVEMMQYTLDKVRRETRNAQIPTIGQTAYDYYLPISIVPDTDPNPTTDDIAGSVLPAPSRPIQHATVGSAPPVASGTIEELSDAVRQFPRSAVYHRELGVALRQASRLEDAARELSEAVRLEPQNPENHYEYGLALRDAAQLRDAAIEIETAARLDNGNGAYAHLLGITLLGDGRSAEAVGVLQRAVRLAPDSAVYCRDLGAAFARAGEHDKAVDIYRHAVRLAPRNLTYRREFALVLDQAHRPAEAVSELREVVRSAPNDPEALFALAVALRADGRLADARAALDSANREKPGMARYYHVLGLLLLEMGRPYEGLRALRESVRLQPDSAGYHYALGMAQVRALQVREAVSTLREAVRLAPENADHRHALALALKESRMPAEALSAFQETIRLKPGEARLRYEIGMFYRELGEPEKAVGELEQAVSLDHSASAYREALTAARRELRSR